MHTNKKKQQKLSHLRDTTVVFVKCNWNGKKNEQYEITKHYRYSCKTLFLRRSHEKVSKSLYPPTNLHLKEVKWTLSWERHKRGIAAVPLLSGGLLTRCLPPTVAVASSTKTRNRLWLISLACYRGKIYRNKQRCIRYILLCGLKNDLRMSR